MTALARALIVPDEQTWTVLDADPASLGLETSFALGSMEQVLAPDAIPEPLAEPFRACLAAVPRGTTIVTQPLPLPAEASVLSAHAPEHARRDEHAGHDEHSGHDHHDMMAIVGEPSADGLVMEPIELRHGPLGTALPGGLAVDATLDGDVVAEAEVHALLHAHTDPLAPVAASAPHGWPGVVAIEVERAVSHLAWLRAFARLLGWPRLVHACTQAIAAAREPATAQPAVDAVVATVHASRWLAARGRGVGIVTTDEAREAGLRGPNARASGVPEDARTDDPRYRALGFVPIVRPDGDALARTLVRADEARAAIDLAVAALGAEGETPSDGEVEGPRVGDGAGARRTAAEAMVGVEWAAALAVLASFDLSAWDVTL